MFALCEYHTVQYQCGSFYGITVYRGRASNLLNHANTVWYLSTGLTKSSNFFFSFFFTNHHISTTRYWLNYSVSFLLFSIPYPPPITIVLSTEYEPNYTALFKTLFTKAAIISSSPREKESNHNPLSLVCVEWQQPGYDIHDDRKKKKVRVGGTEVAVRTDV
ncbi:hypothetical protein L873DRAFT_44370 [Choiromyces venosus 120613-1]|uniref:Uncharacterized protein n=1 Tax=Choiromyces venosus 120613-1 TaxID=1336337 RepID=A0A3N4K0A7_9PEZI|nr:hypothetical protein L873DRAFT_44370 [Choiromyces venosus 120613-1]